MEFKALRDKMVETQIVQRGITDTRVIAAMRKVPRHEFVSPRDIPLAYDDMPLSIGEGQTISQPYMVAVMTQSLELKGEDRVLEIGTGSGYQAAILAEICDEVYTIERKEELARRAEHLLKNLSYHNIKVKVADGSMGWEENILFDAIVVTAATPTPLDNLMSQLKDNGRMVLPIGDRLGQVLTLMTKHKDRNERKEICHCVFVPLVGRFGWNKEVW